MGKLSLRKSLSTMTALTVVAGAVLSAAAVPTYAAGVVLTLTPNEYDGTGTQEITTTWTASTAVESGTFTFTVSPALDATLANCSSADGFADSNGTDGAGSFGSFSTTNATFTTSTATATTGRSLCLLFPVTAQGSYSVAVTSSSSGDYGAALVYVSDDNDVTVTANIAPTLSFNIRTLADDADTNVCDLGTVTTSTLPNGDGVDDGVGECGYGLAVGTNAQGGVQVTIQADAVLNNASSSILDIVNDAAWSAGTEAYGLAYVRAAMTGRDTGTGLYDQNLTEDGNFAVDTTPVPTGATNFVSYTDGINYVAGTDANDLTLVMHGLTIAAGTAAGAYDQVATYRVTATF